MATEEVVITPTISDNKEADPRVENIVRTDTDDASERLVSLSERLQMQSPASPRSKSKKGPQVCVISHGFVT